MAVAASSASILPPPRRRPSPSLLLPSPSLAAVGASRHIRNGSSRSGTPIARVSSDDRTAAASPPLGFEDDREASGVVRAFYAGINARDLASVEGLIGEDCVYEDLIFPKPFTGRKAILNFFQMFNESISRDLQFVIDNISEQDSAVIGVTWHLEWKGKSFPFSKGCSLYQLEVSNGKRQIVYGRDIVEPFFKPGETALAAIRGVTWVLEKFPQLANQL